MSRRWKINRRRKCQCGGYEFPHRKKGGGCHHNPRIADAAVCRARRQGMGEEDLKRLREEVQMTLMWESESPAHQGRECPF